MSDDHRPDLERMPRAEFAFPGPRRDRLVAAILAGEKTATTSLVVGYEVEGEPLPRIGDRAAVVDSADAVVAVVETTSVRVVRLADVDLRHAIDEGEGHRTVQAWRADHEAFWHSDECRRALGDPAFTVDDDTPVVLERFRLLDPT